MRQKTCNVLWVLVGVSGLLFKGRYSGPYRDLIHSYCGNVAVSFAVFFLLRNLEVPGRLRGLWTACLAMAAVSLFEATDGFGMMSNTFDPVDFAADAAGVLLAWGVDELMRRLQQFRSAS